MGNEACEAVEAKLALRLEKLVSITLRMDAKNPLVGNFLFKLWDSSGTFPYPLCYLFNISLLYVRVFFLSHNTTAIFRNNYSSSITEQFFSLHDIMSIQVKK